MIHWPLILGGALALGAVSFALVHVLCAPARVLARAGEDAARGRREQARERVHALIARLDRGTVTGPTEGVRVAAIRLLARLTKESEPDVAAAQFLRIIDRVELDAGELACALSVVIGRGDKGPQTTKVVKKWLARTASSARDSVLMDKLRRLCRVEMDADVKSLADLWSLNTTVHQAIPKLSWPLVGMGVIALISDRPAEAIQHLEKAATDDPRGRAALAFARAASARRSGDLDAVVAQLRLAAEAMPSAVVVRRELGLELARRALADRSPATVAQGVSRLELLKEAAQHLRFAREGEPDAGTLTVLGDVLMALGDHPLAAAVYAEAFVLRPSDRALMHRLVDAQRSAGQLQQALKTLEAHMSTAPSSSADLLLRAEVLLLLERHAEALAQYEKIDASLRHHERVVVGWAQALLAIGHVERLRELHGARLAEWPEGRLLLARALRQDGKRAEALALVESCREDVSGWQIDYLHASLLAEVGRWAEAHATALNFSPADRRKPEALRLLARCKLRAGDMAGASALLRDLLAVDPTSRSTRRLEALVAARQDAPEAPALLDAVLRETPLFLPARLTLAELHAASGRHDVARSVLQFAPSEQATNPALCAALGSALARLGQHAMALQRFDLVSVDMLTLAQRHERARALAGCGRTSAATSELEQLRADLPVDGEAAHLIGGQIASLRRQAAEDAVQAGDLDRAAHLLHAWLGDHPDDAVAGRRLAELLCVMAARRIQGGDTRELDLAEEWLDAARAWIPEDATALYLLGIVAYQRGQLVTLATIRKQLIRVSAAGGERQSSRADTLGTLHLLARFETAGDAESLRELTDLSRSGAGRAATAAALAVARWHIAGGRLKDAGAVLGQVLERGAA